MLARSSISTSSLRVAAIVETVTIVAPRPLIQTASPGRRWCRRAPPHRGTPAQRPPVRQSRRNPARRRHRLSPRSRPKGTQYTPQVLGGAGRNVNYLVDGGDNNDDTVGGQLQLFPLDAIEEFRFSTASYGAENGRAERRHHERRHQERHEPVPGSAFAFFRDDALNARTTTESEAEVPKSDYRRWQFGGSAGRTIRRDKAHFFGAVERVQQDTFQAVETQGLFPALDGVFPVAYRETLLTAKATINLRDADYAWLRYGANLRPARRCRSDRAHTELGGQPQSVSLHQRSLHGILSAAALNELTFQYHNVPEHDHGNTTASGRSFPNGVIIGQGQNIRRPPNSESSIFATTCRYT